MAESPVRVLLIDDDESTFIITRELFDERYAGRFVIDWAGTFEDGLAAIREERHDVYLIDHRLGARSGIDLLKTAIASGCQAPLIMLTGQDSREVDVLAMEAGAADYLVKDVYDVSRLEHAIRYAWERQRLRAALEHERDLQRALMENLPDSIYFKDANSRFLHISKSKALKSGLTDAAEAVGKTDFDFFAPEDAQAGFDDEQGIIRTGQALVGKEEKHIWPDGRETWVVTSKLPLRDKQGNIIGTFGISHDITVQKQALQALRDSEFRTRMIVESALDAFVAMDSDGMIIDWNAQATTTFGWSHHEALGQRLRDLIIPPRFRAAHQAGFENYRLTGQARIMGQRLELIALHRDGREFPVEITISALHLKNSVLFAAFIHDITKRKAAEAALHAAKEVAEAASRAKSDFLANVSHEIRTPMNAILGMTELVLDTKLTSAQREYLSMVSESGEALLLVINDILDFSKIEAGKLDLVLDLFRLRETLGDTMKSLAVRAHRENLELAFRVAGDVPETLIGDAGRLRQIIVNLIGNAIKFTQQGEVVLDVSQEESPRRLGLHPDQTDPRDNGGEDDRDRKESQDGGPTYAVTHTPILLLHFYVRDTGIGIPPEKQSLIFEAFEQADTSTTRKYGGTGLGLAISQRLVMLMGGKIWVDSEVGIGSTFHFTARFVVSLSALDSLPTKSVMMHGTRVLIVDDNATNRLILEEMMRNWGLIPACVASANQALEKLRLAASTGEPFAVVLSDLHMPDIDGFMLAKTIRKDPRLAKTPILILTSGERQGDAAKCQQFGVSAYLLKPVKQSELFNALVAALGVNSPEDHSEHQPVAAVAAALPPLRLLLAEDSIANQKLAVGLLSKWGHHVTVANNGQEALLLWSNPPGGKPFDAILMDVQMPEMDGFEATAAIREREQSLGRRTPIVAMTAHAMKGDREQCLAGGMDGYVAKPVRQQELVAVLRETVLGQSAERPAERDIARVSEIARVSGKALAAGVLPVEATPATPVANAIPLKVSADGVPPRRLNWQRASEMVGNDRELLAEVMGAFLEEGPMLLERMIDAAGRNDWTNVAKSSHTLQAALRLFEGNPLELATSLEGHCKRGTPEESRSVFAKFSAELENVFAEVREFQKASG